MWQSILENGKLIISSVLLVISLVAGGWTFLTTTFTTRTDSEDLSKRFSTEIAYNKAFRLETKISRVLLIKGQRELSPTEAKELTRLKSQLNDVDNHLEKVLADIGAIPHQD